MTNDMRDWANMWIKNGQRYAQTVQFTNNEKWFRPSPLPLMGISISISLLGTATGHSPIGLGNSSEGRFHMRIIEDFLTAPHWGVGVSNSIELVTTELCVLSIQRKIVEAELADAVMLSAKMDNTTTASDVIIFGLEVLDGRAANAGFLQLFQPPSHRFFPARKLSWQLMMRTLAGATCGATFRVLSAVHSW